MQCIVYACEIMHEQSINNKEKQNIGYNIFYIKVHDKGVLILHVKQIVKIEGIAVNFLKLFLAYKMQWKNVTSLALQIK